MSLSRDRIKKDIMQFKNKNIMQFKNNYPKFHFSQKIVFCIHMRCLEVCGAFTTQEIDR
jgi:hypothetical protein